METGDIQFQNRCEKCGYEYPHNTVHHCPTFAIPADPLSVCKGLKMDSPQEQNAVEALIERVEEYQAVFQFSKIFAQLGVDRLTQIVEENQLALSQFEKECLTSLIFDYHRLAKEKEDIKNEVIAVLSDLKKTYICSQAEEEDVEHVINAACWRISKYFEGETDDKTKGTE